MATHPTIETNRLILRTVSMEDLAHVAACWNLDARAISLKEAEEKIRWMQHNHVCNMPGNLTHLCLAVIDKSTQELIGWCGLDHRDQTTENPVLFYLLKRNSWGKGLATEATSALIRYAFEELNLTRIDSAAASENIASQRVMEKAHMRYVGIDEEGGSAFTLSREEYFNL